MPGHTGTSHRAHAVWVSGASIATATLSPAEAISVINNGMALAGHFGDGVMRAADMASGMLGAIVKDPVQDQVVWTEYLETIVKERSDWKDLYRAFREQV